MYEELSEERSDACELASICFVHLNSHIDVMKQLATGCHYNFDQKLCHVMFHVQFPCTICTGHVLHRMECPVGAKQEFGKLRLVCETRFKLAIMLIACLPFSRVSSHFVPTLLVKRLFVRFLLKLESTRGKKSTICIQDQC
ncbi:hypothetical protein T4B_2352 [Trichinella pseudospiralis]|uniref:Uncharacterized protein n=1 Tax=Trichinella pseudospiralis TaxID=6337 RepID=A0A0V1JA85_TRIPS|nr:hypothetical protein T4B_2352 [Trichinella pseudospiralis]